ncbi:hypothetical protein N7495_005600 [Penicillium taxi]|uniref:uncharacterized protein n=1 Tax=Penicillium taxi TaxID=168475 RepID=UPI0025457283|nr:uncharacterized protein N7495_005600 [Penicillium taxi]KAJ5893909.1 hypothetical protein N7495_005600 [Penicillium taxi]
MGFNGRLQRRQEKLEKECEMVDWGVPLADLPVMEWDEFQQQARTGCNIIVIRGAVHDISGFVTEHPGGTAMIIGAMGKDATEMFEGEYTVIRGRPLTFGIRCG